MDYKFTAHMEDQLDDVAMGKLKWDKVLKKFYDQFSPLVEKIDKCIKTKDIIDKNMRELGKHPETGDKIIATIAKYGEIVKMFTDKDDLKKCIIAPIKKPLTLKNITLADALKLFEYPKELGRHDRKLVTLNKGKFGFYLKIGTDKTAEKISVKLEEENVNDFTLDDAIKVINVKEECILWKGCDAKFKYIVLNGPYGKYISAKPIKGVGKGKNCKLPEDEDHEKLTIERVAELISAKKTYSTKWKKKDGNVNDAKSKPKKITKKKKSD